MMEGTLLQRIENIEKRISENFEVIMGVFDEEDILNKKLDGKLEKISKDLKIMNEKIPQLNNAYEILTAEKKGPLGRTLSFLKEVQKMQYVDLLQLTGRWK